MSHQEELLTKLRSLEAKLVTLESIEEIKKVQRAYGYYIEHGMCEEVIDLFADENGVALWHAGIGTYQGKSGIRHFFEGFSKDARNPEFLHQLIIVSAIINLDPDGVNAKGRWYGIGTIAMPYKDAVIPTNIGTIYENDYLKENGKWKIKALRIYITYGYNMPGGGIVNPDRLPKVLNKIDPPDPAGFDVSDHTNAWYPSGYIVPFHFEHPVTGKMTSESARNAALTKA